MTRPIKQNISLTGEIHPDQFYRTTLSPVLFGIGWQATQNKIKTGELPPPFGAPPGWTGQQILDHRADMQKLAAEKLAAQRSAAKQPQPKILVGKTKKQKLAKPQRKRA